MYQHLTNLDFIYQPICLIIRMCRDSCHKGKTYSRSIRSGSMFENSHVRLQIWMHFIYRFNQGLRLRQVDMLQEGITRSSATLTDKLRSVCKSAVRRRGQQTIGRRREVVMIDESKCGHKRKRTGEQQEFLGVRNAWNQK
ncbi:hypothetical protein JOQ06_024240 [Pogonophryne albipinna]|uniref:Uncharacterized protein n=1 Tax=Pogonophryne albipinna TaxID=1090488 RepID=A0AAD6BQT2_9TELE|nr:hypothetical protein JOQ06_024240 [Pogonophryne albipinna]